MFSINNYDERLIQSTAAQQKTYVIEKAEPKNSVSYVVIKRLIDIVCSLVVGLLLLPVMLIVGVAVCIDSPGGMIYRQKRLGKDGKEFYILKFRTMYEDAEKDGPQWAESEDQRCTRLGTKLRKYRIDELPQAYNILVGDMSFVGPRPERPCFYEEFETYIHGFSNRLAVVPGLTGLAQVNGGYNLLPEEKIIYDMEYIKTRSLWLDFKIVLKTIGVVFKGKGAK